MRKADFAFAIVVALPLIAAGRELIERGFSWRMVPGLLVATIAIAVLTWLRNGRKRIQP